MFLIKSRFVHKQLKSVSHKEQVCTRTVKKSFFVIKSRFVHEQLESVSYKEQVCTQTVRKCFL